MVSKRREGVSQRGAPYAPDIANALPCGRWQSRTGVRDKKKPRRAVKLDLSGMWVNCGNKRFLVSHCLVFCVESTVDGSLSRLRIDGIDFPLWRGSEGREILADNEGEIARFALIKPLIPVVTAFRDVHIASLPILVSDKNFTDDVSSGSAVEFHDVVGKPVAKIQAKSFESHGKKGRGINILLILYPYYRTLIYSSQEKKELFSNELRLDSTGTDGLVGRLVVGRGRSVDAGNLVGANRKGVMDRRDGSLVSVPHGFAE